MYMSDALRVSASVGGDFLDFLKSHQKVQHVPCDIISLKYVNMHVSSDNIRMIYIYILYIYYACKCV